jgi:hypothetical protein
VVDTHADDRRLAWHSRLPRWLLLTCVGILVIGLVWIAYALVAPRGQKAGTPGPLKGGIAELEAVTGIRFPDTTELLETYSQPVAEGVELLALFRLPHADLDRFVKSLPAGVEIVRDPANTPYLGVHEGFGEATGWWQPDLAGNCMVVFIPLHETERGDWVASKLIVALDDPQHAGIHLQAYWQ